MIKDLCGGLTYLYSTHGTEETGWKVLQPMRTQMHGLKKKKKACKTAQKKNLQKSETTIDEPGFLRTAA